MRDAGRVRIGDQTLWTAGKPGSWRDVLSDAKTTDGDPFDDEGEEAAGRCGAPTRSGSDKKPLERPLASSRLILDKDRSAGQGNAAASREGAMRWTMRIRVRRQELTMDAMMIRADVDQLALARDHRGRTFASARTICARCLVDAQCRRWLEAADQGAAAPSFCPNAPLFSRFRVNLDSQPEAAG